MLPDFRQKLLLAVRTVETVVSRVQSRVLLLESEVQGKCQGLERKLEGRLNNLDREFYPDALRRFPRVQGKRANPMTQVSKHPCRV
jgi:hypothetical protein